MKKKIILQEKETIENTQRTRWAKKLRDWIILNSHSDLNKCELKSKNLKAFL